MILGGKPGPLLNSRTDHGFCRVTRLPLPIFGLLYTNETGGEQDNFRAAFFLSTLWARCGEFFIPPIQEEKNMIVSLTAIC
jgi:hypothetical protein